MEEKKEERGRWRLRRPCRVTADRLQTLERHLKAHHGSVEVVAVAETGFVAKGNVDDLTRHGGMWGRLRSMHFRCTAPDLNLRLSDKPWNVVSMEWASPGGDQSAAGVERDLPHWFRWSLLPCDLALVLIATWFLLTIPWAWRLPAALAGQERARVEAARRLDEYVRAKTSNPEEAEALRQRILREAKENRDRIPGWLVPAIVLVAVFALVRFGILRILAAWWGKLFPAAYWDFPSQAHVFASEPVRLWVLKIGLLLLLTYYGVSAYGAI